MLRIFYITNIVSLFLYIPSLFVHLNNTNPPAYFNILFLMLVAMLFLSIRSLSVVINHIKLKISKDVISYIIALFPLVFPFSGVFIAAYFDDKRQVIPYLLFQIYYFARFYPVLKKMEVRYHV